MFNVEQSNTTDVEIKNKLKPFEQLINEISEYESELQKEYNSLKSDLSKYDIEKILTTTIDFPDSIEIAAIKLKKVTEIMKSHAIDFKDISANIANRIKTIKLVNPKKQPLIDTVYSLIAGGDYNINEYFLIQDSIVKHITKLQTFLSDNKGKYKMVGEEVRFLKKKDQNVFTKFGNRLLELWQKEKEWLIRIKQQGGIVDEKIHTEIEKYL
jgi:hypothetical protein